MPQSITAPPCCHAMADSIIGQPFYCYSPLYTASKACSDAYAWCMPLPLGRLSCVPPQACSSATAESAMPSMPQASSGAAASALAADKSQDAESRIRRLPYKGYSVQSRRPRASTVINWVGGVGGAMMPPLASSLRRENDIHSPPCTARVKGVYWRAITPSAPPMHGASSQWRRPTNVARMVVI